MTVRAAAHKVQRLVERVRQRRPVTLRTATRLDGEFAAFQHALAEERAGIRAELTMLSARIEQCRTGLDHLTRVVDLLHVAMVDTTAARAAAVEATSAAQAAASQATSAAQAAASQATSAARVASAEATSAAQAVMGSTNDHLEGFSERLALLDGALDSISDLVRDAHGRIARLEARGESSDVESVSTTSSEE